MEKYDTFEIFQITCMSFLPTLTHLPVSMHWFGNTEIKERKWKDRIKENEIQEHQSWMLASHTIRQKQRRSTGSAPRSPGWKQIRKHRAAIWLGFRKTFLFVTGTLRPLKIRSKTNSSQCWTAMSSRIVWLARFLWLKLMPHLAKAIILAIGTIWEKPQQSGFPTPGSLRITSLHLSLSRKNGMRCRLVIRI